MWVTHVGFKKPETWTLIELIPVSHFGPVLQVSLGYSIPRVAGAESLATAHAAMSRTKHDGSNGIWR